MVKWEVSRYNTHYLYLSKNIVGFVAWRTSKSTKDWVAQFMQQDLGSFDSIDDAKATVINWARKELTYALKKLDDSEKGEKND